MKRQLAALLLGLSTLPGIAAEAWRDALPHAQMIGQGDYRWLGMRIYEAQLWTGQPSASLVSAVPADPASVLDAPLALRLVYARDIGAQRLVDTSIDEIVRMQGHSLSGATLQRWRDALSRVMVDVRAGDRLTGVYLPNQGARFYANDRATGQIDDPALARAFFSIWLGPATRDPGLRQKLLGLAR
ncbi:chalcone isomerase family protein [Cupriavidus pauculus]|uniref:chalcone isomerase family protein n=1 Tax=Cupriavidus pauculus TaxID=82633 RepID=UPI001D0C9C1B|nr:chalcone isomerase family protein [Cupriavidus pauculus]